MVAQDRLHLGSALIVPRLWHRLSLRWLVSSREWAGFLDSSCLRMEPPRPRPVQRTGRPTTVCPDWTDRGAAEGDPAEGDYEMKKVFVSVLAAATLPLAACATNDDTLASAGTGAAIGAAAGAGVSAIAGTDLLTSAAIGAAVGGLAGAVWADRNNDGVADGYVYNGQYYEGSPAGYQAASVQPRDCRSVLGTAATGAAAGAAVGAGAGALIGGLGVLEGAVIGAAVGGLGGAVWADANNDGCVDGYVREGQYYSGGPVVQPVPASYTGERG